MSVTHVGLASLFDHLAGRDDPRVVRHLTDCPPCAARAAWASRLIAAGRRAGSAPRPSRRALARAASIFRRHHRAPQPSVLQLVLDSLLRPAPALRAATAAPTRFLRYEGEATLELQITPVGRRVELRGQVTPADVASEVVLRAGTVRRRRKLAADGTFVIRAVPRGEVEIEVGPVRVAGLNV